MRTYMLNTLNIIYSVRLIIEANSSFIISKVEFGQRKKNLSLLLIQKTFDHDSFMKNV